MIDPDFWSDEKLGTKTRDERLFFMGLISNADDEGYGRANIKLLKATIFPYDDDIKPCHIENMLRSLKGMVFVYIIDSQEFYYIPNFLKHQVINKPTPSKLPRMPDNAEEIQLPEYYGNATGELPPKRKEDKRKEYNAHDVNDFFEKVWFIYPNKKGKGQIKDTQKEKLYSIGFEQLERCINRYKSTKEDWKEWQHGSTFFNSGYIDYLDGNFTEAKKGGPQYANLTGIGMEQR
jgi:hypothetical protein